MTELNAVRKSPTVVEDTLSAYKLWFGYRDHFPKKSRYTLGDKIDSRFINALELLALASYQSAAEKLATLSRAIVALDTLKFLLQVAWELNLLDNRKYADLSEKLHRIGQQAGGWRKGLANKTPAAG